MTTSIQENEPEPEMGTHKLDFRILTGRQHFDWRLRRRSPGFSRKLMMPPLGLPSF